MLLQKRTAGLILAAGVCLSIGWLIWTARKGLYAFVAGAVLAYLLNPVIGFLERRGMSRLWAIIFIYVVMAGLFILAVKNLVPAILTELQGLGRELPVLMSHGEALLRSLQERYESAPVPDLLRNAVNETLGGLAEKTESLISFLLSGVVGLVGQSISIMLTPVLAFYLLYDWQMIKQSLLAIFPTSWRSETEMLLQDIDNALEGVIRGQVIIAVAVGFCASVGLFLLGVRYALIVGIFAGILDIIPYFGAILGAIPAVAMAVLSGADPVWLPVKVLAMFVLIHQLEGTIIGPKIIGDCAGFHPLTVIFILMVGGEVWGLSGMLFGVPVAAVARVFLRRMARLLSTRAGP